MPPPYVLKRAACEVESVLRARTGLSPERSLVLLSRLQHVSPFFECFVRPIVSKLVPKLSDEFFEAEMEIVPDVLQFFVRPGRVDKQSQLLNSLHNGATRTPWTHSLQELTRLVPK